ncbi:MAG: hypothetical protein RBR67_15480 [Desulfobacterium sp.]|nr:hypothetical protein [Desulfobacterium sp.]
MTIELRLKKLEAWPKKCHAFMNSMEEITQEDAESAYNKLMTDPHPPLFAITAKGRIPFEDLSEAKTSITYSQYTQGNLEIITT